MEWMTRSDMILMGIGAYVALMSLVRLMRRRRDDVVADVERQMEAHRRHRKRHRPHAAEHEDRGAA